MTVAGMIPQHLGVVPESADRLAVVELFVRTDPSEESGEDEDEDEEDEENESEDETSDDEGDSGYSE
jgi:hypothetical protein